MLGIQLGQNPTHVTLQIYTAIFPKLLSKSVTVLFSDHFTLAVFFLADQPRSECGFAMLKLELYVYLCWGVGTQIHLVRGLGFYNL